MKSINMVRTAAAIAVTIAVGGCSSWQRTDKETGTATGAVGGAVAGAAVGGPVGAVVGGVGGAVVGHETTGYGPDRTTTARAGSTGTSAYDSSTIRNVQQALNSRGFNVGPIDGQYGAATQDAVRRFQAANGLPATGELNRSTLSALGVS
jgi:murein L,D-transpeptidase YcbB/YkuD